MIEKIDHVVIFVTNMENAKSFYTDKLDLKIAYPSPEYTSVAVPGGTTIGLHIADEVAGHGSRKATTQVSFAVADIETAYKDLSDKGVRITSEIQDIAPGRFMFNFVDQDNNQLSFYEHRE